MFTVRPNINFFKRNIKTNLLKHRDLSGQKKLRSLDLEQIFVTSLNILNTIYSLNSTLKKLLKTYKLLWI